jgi:hypothetical protein
MLRAKSHPELLDLMFDYRMRNNIALGDPERDVSDWYCPQYPRFCTPEPSDTDPSALRTSSEPMLNRVSRWASMTAHRMPRGGFPLVAPAAAESRALICAACPKQDSSWRGACGGCSATTLAILQQLKSLKKTTKDGNLGACSIAGWANLVAVWLPTDALEITDAQKAALPAACWRKAIPP